MGGARPTSRSKGGDFVISIHPKIQEQILVPSMPRDARGIEAPVEAAAVKRLMAMPEFVRAYEPDGMKPEEFVAYGLTQRTLGEFYHNGYGLLEKWR